VTSRIVEIFHDVLLRRAKAGKDSA